MRRILDLNSNRDQRRRQNNTLAAAIVTSFMTTLNSSALNLSIPGIGSDFGVSAQAVGWVVTIYALASVALSLPFGRLADLTSRVKVMRLGVLVFTAGCVSAVFAVNFSFFITMRLVQGIGAAMIFSTSSAVLIGAFPASDRGRVLGLSVCATYIGLSTGPVVGGFLNSMYGWRSVLVLVSAVGLASLYMTWLRLPSDGGSLRAAREMDWLSSALYSAGLVSLMYGISEIGSGGHSLVLSAAGLIILAVFLRRQLKLDNPLLKVSLFASSRSFTYSNLAALMNYAATFAMSYLMSIYLQIIRGIPSRYAGIILISAPLMQAVISPVAGRLSDRHSPYKLSSAGMGFCAAALLLLCTLDGDASLARIVINLAIMGVGFGFFSSPNTNAIMSSVSREDSGVASSIVATMCNLGQTLSMAIVTVVVSMNLGATSLEAANPAGVLGVIRLCFAIFSAICVAGIFAALMRSDKE